MSSIVDRKRGPHWEEVAVLRGKESLLAETTLTVFFDGACEPVNPGGLPTYGWLVMSGSSEVAFGYGVAGERGKTCATNNVAEYAALGRALRWLSEHGWRGRLVVRGDSQLVVNQVRGVWKCNKDHLVRLRDRVRDLLSKLGGDNDVGWVPRDQNDRCDALSRRAYEEHTGQIFPERKKRRP